MSEYDELVRDLNDLQVLPPMECIEDFNDAHDRKLYGRAADAIEALVKERDVYRNAFDALRDQQDETLSDYEGQKERAEKAGAEVKRLTAALEFYSWRGHYKPMHDDPEVPGSIAEPEVLQDMGRIARKALEAKP